MAFVGNSFLPPFRYTSRFTLSTCHVRSFHHARGRLIVPERPYSRMMADLPRDATEMTESEWKEVLDPRAFHVLRQKGTEPAGSGEYDKFYPDEGHFACGGCNAPLYSAKAKFNSGCGWPAFDKCYKGAVTTKTDVSFGMRRVEILCSNCNGHLGHVFEVECEVCESQSGPRGDQGSVRIQFIHDQWQTQWTLGEYYGSVRTRMSPGAEVNVCLGSCKFGVL